MADYKVKQGDCLSSIAVEHGFFPDTVWNHDQNRELRACRPDPNVLEDGDRIFIPDKRLGSQTAASEETHRFRRKGVPELLRLQLEEGGEARASLEFRIVIDGKIERGFTDDKGWLECSIPANARTAELLIGESESYTIKLGHLDPVDSREGLVARLCNLGHLSAANPGDEEIALAIAAFQKEHKLATTGETDAALQDKLVAAHGC